MPVAGTEDDDFFAGAAAGAAFLADDAAGAGVDLGAGGALAAVFAAGAGEADGFVEGDSAAAEADEPPEAASSFFFLVDGFAEEDLSVAAAVADALSAAESAWELFLEPFFVEVDPFVGAVEPVDEAAVSLLFLEDAFFVFVEAASSPEGAEVSLAPASLFFFDDFDFDVPDEAVESSDALASDFLDFFVFFVEEADDWSLAEPVWDCAQTKEANASSKYIETKAAKRAALFFIRSS